MTANESLPDQTSAIGVGTALALAFYHKSRTGEGQYLETAMIISNLYLCSDDFVRYQGKPKRPEVDEELRGLHALHRLYRAKEGWIFLTCPLEEEWESLCKAINREDLMSDPRFNSPAARAQNDEWLTATLWPVFSERTAEDWETYLIPHGVAVAQADKESYQDFLLTDQGAKEAGLVVDIEHKTVGKMKRVSPAIEFSLTPSRAGAPHILGEDTPAILVELGYGNTEIDNLRTTGVIRWNDPS